MWTGRVLAGSCWHSSDERTNDEKTEMGQDYGDPRDGADAPGASDGRDVEEPQEELGDAGDTGKGYPLTIPRQGEAHKSSPLWPAPSSSKGPGPQMLSSEAGAEQVDEGRELEGGRRRPCREGELQWRVRRVQAFAQGHSSEAAPGETRLI